MSWFAVAVAAAAEWLMALECFWRPMEDSGTVEESGV
ncbi:hypothetical protein chiPu_0030901, partial [Chiloscyllium punctatum]|nr:hypothetical protein [Chiloscyllium punctatum]